MMKRTLKVLGVATLLIAAIVSVPMTAQAARRVNRSRVTINNTSNAVVVNGTTAVANTGGNNQTLTDDANIITTGGATAGASSTNVVNTSLTIVAVGQQN